MAKSKLTPSVFGIGFIGVGDYKPSFNGRNTKQYISWKGMLERCYSPKWHKEKPTYIGCTVCDEWLNFQAFAEWYDASYITGFQLDKDIKLIGNKIYSPENCKFVSSGDNNEMAHAKDYIMKDPKGEFVMIYNMADFCRRKGLNQSHMIAVSKGSRKSHKGWVSG